MVALSQNEKEVIVSFPKELIDLESVKKFIERIELEELAKKSELNAENVEKKNRVLKRVASAQKKDFIGDGAISEGGNP